MNLTQLFEMRQSGKVPDGLVLVSLVGYLPLENCQVLPRKQDKDFSAMIAMDVQIMTNDQGINAAIDLADKIIAAKPQYLAIKNTESKTTIVLVDLFQRCFIGIKGHL